VFLSGSRQVGKTTLARKIIGKKMAQGRDVLNLSTYFSLTPRKFNSSMHLYTLQDQNRGRGLIKDKRGKAVKIIEQKNKNKVTNRRNR